MHRKADEDERLIRMQVYYDVGEMYGGQVPIDESDPSRKLFFIFKPAIHADVDEVTIFLNVSP